MRIAKAVPFAEELAEYSRESHEGASFHIDRRAFEGLWYALPFSRTRDADAREESNFTVISNDLETRFPETVQSHSFGHWACGWYERLYVRKDDVAAILAAQAWADALAGYPVADEEHCSELEYERDHPNETDCYSSDPECSCPVNTHECAEMLASAFESGEVTKDSEEWYCDFCGDWRELDAEERARLASWEYRQECAALESAGQMRLLDIA
jgi:hypothetical protein